MHLFSKFNFILCACMLLLTSCSHTKQDASNSTTKNKPSINKRLSATNQFNWNAATIYFLLTDRFKNGDLSNDINVGRTTESAKLRGYLGGDLKGITQKIKEGYFNRLGIDAIWLTPVVEQIHGYTDEGTGVTYGFHGYWTKDWTNIDPNVGTKADLHELVETAHANNIRILLDAVINHTGPVTVSDSVWPPEWVRTKPKCKFDTYINTTNCTLVDNLPDIRTDSNEEVELPPPLVSKWKAEGRYEQEIKELDEFFARTGYPKAPRFYLIKWLTDYITEFGIDGYRVDTVKHVEESVWQEFRVEADYAFAQFKRNNPDKVLDESPFYLVGEVYNYGISTGQWFDLGDKKVNYFDQAFNSLLNFHFKWHARQNSYEDLFKLYSKYMSEFIGESGTLNYIASHDDGEPFDLERSKAFEGATKLLLSPGTSQIYYGDEVARPLQVDGVIGDANLRSAMQWDEHATKATNKNHALLKHYQKLGKFRQKHPAIGAGEHSMLSQTPYLFTRKYEGNNGIDIVLIGLDLPLGEKILNVNSVFAEGSKVHDAYSGVTGVVTDNKVSIDSPFNIVLLEIM